MRLLGIVSRGFERYVSATGTSLEEAELARIVTAPDAFTLQSLPPTRAIERAAPAESGGSVLFQALQPNPSLSSPEGSIGWPRNSSPSTSLESHPLVLNIYALHHGLVATQ